jgi:hypothetical protein
MKRPRTPGGRQRGQHGLGIRHLRHTPGIHETRDFDALEAAGHQAPDELHLGVGGQHLGLALQAIARPDFDDFDALLVHVRILSFGPPWALGSLAPVIQRAAMTDTQPSRGALADLRVLELGTLIAGTFLRPIARRHGGGGHQDRGARPGRSHAPLGPAAARHTFSVVAGDRPQQEGHHTGPATGRRPEPIQALGSQIRRRHRELPAGARWRNGTAAGRCFRASTHASYWSACRASGRPGPTPSGPVTAA